MKSRPVWDYILGVKLAKIAAQFLGAIFLLELFSFLSPRGALAHCDTLDGPVVSAGRKALATENANYVLIWVKPADENEIRKALRKAREKMKQAKTQAEKDEAEREFFEILVKIHREGEGAEYEGLKPAGAVEPEIALADAAVATGKLDEVLRRIDAAPAREVVTHLFHQVQEKFRYAVRDVPAGREFIAAYVQFIHTVEKALKGEAVSAAAHHH